VPRRTTLALLALLTGCSCHRGPAAPAPDASSAEPPDAAPVAEAPDAAPPPDADLAAGPDASAAEAEDAAAPDDPDAGAPDASSVDAGPSCAVDEYVDALVQCMEGGSGPDLCLAAVATRPLCDSDGDGVGDDLELALARAYAPVLLMNGGAWGGNPEDAWFANVRHFVASAQLYWRPDGVTASLVDAAPTLASLPGETFVYQASSRLASDPAAGQGSDFWLCLKDDSDPIAVVRSIPIMMGLPDGIDVEFVVHPANGALAGSSHYFVAFVPFWAYNSHSTVDDHQGDREIVAVFVDRGTGAVDAADFERHQCTDMVHWVDVATYGAKDPGQDVPTGDVTLPPAGVRGLRFWDFAGHRHHLAVFVSTGGHALYDFPGNTFIVPKGMRDTHDGDGARLHLSTALFQATWNGAAVPIKLNWHNPGEPSRIVLPWASYRGQWGCQQGSIANSYPGPFGNARHPRTAFEKLWGSPPHP
jgi:hypothetical protein